MKRCIILLAVGLMLNVFVPVCWAADTMVMAAPAPADAKPVAANQVSIDNFTFVPQVVTVSAGTTVTWTNKDDIPHLVVITALKARSPALDTDQSYSLKFDTPGKYEYFCGMHPKMTGIVVVTAPKP